MKQQSFLPKTRYNQQRQHGGILAVGKRRSRRPLSLKHPLHVTLRSDLARGRRSLLSNRHIVTRVFQRFSKRFHVKVYDKAICGNHIHCMIKGETRKDLQNFFRVVAGQIAQEILRDYPLQPHEQRRAGGTPRPLRKRRPHPKNVRTFWSLLLWSRVVSWGRDCKNVLAYVLQNAKEALGLVAYKTRKSRFTQNRSSNSS